MKVALLSPDDRERLKTYGAVNPVVPAVEAALLEGLVKQPELEVHYVSCLQQPVPAPEKLGPNIWYHALHVPKLGWMRTGYQGCIRAIRKKLRDLQPDIVHGQGAERECALSAAYSGFPNVVTIHGNMKSIAEFYRSTIGSFHWLAGKLETVALRKTDGVFCNSAYTERVVAPRTRRTWRVANAVRAKFFNPLPAMTRCERPILLNVGMVTPHKRQLEILAVARRLWQRGCRFEMHFAGKVNADTTGGAEFLRLMAEAEAAGYARHLGELEVDALINAFDRSSALVHFPTEEAFGLVVAEALARNLKLFGASVGGVIDIASGVDGAELFPLNDWAGLENAITRWLEQGAVLPAKAATVMRERYHPEVIAQQHVEIYREVLGRKQG